MKDASKKEKVKKQAEQAARRAFKRDAAHLEHLRDVREGLSKSRKNASNVSLNIFAPIVISLKPHHRV